MTPDQKHALIELLDKLSASDLAALTRFAEFLLHQSTASPRQKFTFMKLAP